MGSSLARWTVKKRLSISLWADRSDKAEPWSAGALALVASLAACGGQSNPPPAPQTTDGAVTVAGWRAFVGSSGTFGQTFNGVTWSTRQIGPWDLFSVTCADNLHGWSAGSSGFIAHTIDGGGTWLQQTSGLTANLRAIKFGTATLGLVGGDGGTLAMTTDGGTTWVPVSTGTQGTVRGVAVSATGVLLAVGDGGFGLRSTDGGSTWSPMVIAGAGDILAVAMDPGAQTAIMGDSTGRVWWTINQGRSFYLETSAPQAIRALSITDDGTRALAVGDGGTVLERSASGVWNAVNSGTSAALYAALILDGDTREYVAGERGTLMQSVDHGVDWTAMDVATTATIFGLDDL
jgi:photosystem II stability/assembly factor-like uncharacterized protein